MRHALIIFTAALAVTSPVIVALVIIVMSGPAR